VASSENLAVTVDGVTVEVSNPDKPLFGGESTTGDSRITKGDLARYYAAIGPTMLPHVRGRPMTLVRYPNGLGGDSFFQKHTPKHYPDWIPRVELKKKGGVIHHSVVDHPAALVYFAQQNVITLHIGLARLPHLDTPDVFVVDLDPSTDDLDQVRRVALGVKDAFERAGLAPFVQLTGSKGLHIVAPLAAGPGATWANAQSFGRAVSTVLLNRFPDDLTMEFSKSERGDRIYLDMGRNNYPATFAAPYAVRAFPEAPVVTPVGWDELEDPAFHPRRYTIATVFDRLREHGDPWAGMAEAARPLPA
jgi:bifunctional non-homologous end joining protein LigD